MKIITKNTTLNCDDEAICFVLSAEDIQNIKNMPEDSMIYLVYPKHTKPEEVEALIKKGEKEAYGR